MKPTLMMYIDGNNFYKNIAELYGVKNVYPKWKSMILGIRDLVQQDYDCYFSKAYFFSSLSDRADNPTKYDNHKKFLDKLSECPYIDTIIGKLKCVPKDKDIPIDKNNPDTYKHVEKNTDVNMSNEMLLSDADIIVILSADSDFENTVNILRQRGKTILAIAPIGSKTSQIRNVVGQDNMIYLNHDFLDNYIGIKKIS